MVRRGIVGWREGDENRMQPWVARMEHLRWEDTEQSHRQGEGMWVEHGSGLGIGHSAGDLRSG